MGDLLYNYLDYGWLAFSSSCFSVNLTQVSIERINKRKKNIKTHFILFKIATGMCRVEKPRNTRARTVKVRNERISLTQLTV